MSDLFKKLEHSLWGKASSDAAGGGPESGATPMIGNTVVKETKWNTRWRRFLRATVNVVTGGFGPIVVPSVVLNRFGDEDYFPEDKLFWNQEKLAALALNFNMLGIVNPVGSGVLAIVNIEAWRETTAGEIIAFDNSPNTAALVPPALGGSGQPRDFRLGLASLGGSARAFVVAGQSAGGLVSIAVSRGASGAFISPWRVPTFVLPPGTSVALQPDIVNEGFACGFAWREIVLPSA